MQHDDDQSGQGAHETLSPEATGLLAALRDHYSDHAHQHPVNMAHREWVRSVEARLRALEERSVAGSGDSAGKDAGTATGPRASTALPRDATTAALERAGEALAAQQQAEQPVEPEACKRCGRPLKVNGRMRSCAPCSTSWMEPEKRVSLAQSPWVLDETSQRYTGPWVEMADGRTIEGAVDVEVVENQQRRIRELESVLAARFARIVALEARGRELEAEVERLKAANAAPVLTEEQALRRDTVITWLHTLMVRLQPGCDDADVWAAARELRAALRLGPDRIVFSVREVLP
jgi:hypothetical protein